MAPSGDGVLVVRRSGALPPGTAHVHPVAARKPVIASREGAGDYRWLESVAATFEVSP